VAAFVVDSFTGTDGTALTAHTGETGATWTQHPALTNGTLKLTGNRVYRGNGTANDCLCYASGTPASAAYTVRGLWTKLTDGDMSLSVWGRLDTSAVTGYQLDQYNGTDYFRLNKVVANTYTQLGNFNDNVPNATTRVGDLELTDASKRAYVDGLLRLSSSDNAVTAAGRVGVRVWGTGDASTTGTQLDSIEARDAPSNFLEANVAATIQNASASPQSFTGITATRSGALLVALLEIKSPTVTVSSVTDSAGNTWTKQGDGVVSGQNSKIEGWASPTGGSVTSLTVTLSAAAACSLTLVDVLGFDSAFNDTDTADGSGDATSDTTFGGGTLSPTAGKTVLLLHGMSVASTSTAFSTFTPAAGWWTIAVQGPTSTLHGNAAIARFVPSASGGYTGSAVGSLAAVNGYYAIAIREAGPAVPATANPGAATATAAAQAPTATAGASASLGAAAATAQARTPTALAAALATLGLAASSLAALPPSGAAGSAALLAAAAATAAAPPPSVAAASGATATLGVATATAAAPTVLARGTPPSSTLVGASSATATGGTTLTIPLPAGTAVGHFLAAVVFGRCGPGLVAWWQSGPAGWDLEAEYDDGVVATASFTTLARAADVAAGHAAFVFGETFADEPAAGVLIGHAPPTGTVLAYDDASGTHASSPTTAATSSPVHATAVDNLIDHALVAQGVRGVTPPPFFAMPAGGFAATVARTLAIGGNPYAGATGYLDFTATLSAPADVYVFAASAKLLPAPVVANVGTASATAAAPTIAATAAATALLGAASATADAPTAVGLVGVAAQLGAATADADAPTVHALSIGPFPPRPTVVLRVRAEGTLARDRFAVSLARHRSDRGVGRSRFDRALVRVRPGRALGRWRLEPGGDPMPQLGGTFDFVQGDTVQEIWQFFEEDGATPVGGFAGADVCFTARDAGGAVVLEVDTLDAITITDATNAVCSVNIPYTSTQGIAVGSYDYDIQVTEAGSAPRRVTTLEFGRMTVMKQITKRVFAGTEPA